MISDDTDLSSILSIKTDLQRIDNGPISLPDTDYPNDDWDILSCPHCEVSFLAPPGEVLEGCASCREEEEDADAVASGETTNPYAAFECGLVVFSILLILIGIANWGISLAYAALPPLR
jgi:hypothetical protein